MTTPSGRLAWGQAQVYDAVDDRSVITALARNKVGLVRPPEVAAGAGLALIIRGGWLGVASCGDRTSAVVGERADITVQANPGPGTGTRDDVIWCDTNPDEGYWELHVITATQAATRDGLPLAGLVVPANANLASQMTIIPMDASLDRRLLSVSMFNNGNVAPGLGWNYTTWGQATPINCESQPCVMEPGQWYRVRYFARNPDAQQGSLIGRIGVGYRTAGQAVTTSVIGAESTIGYPALNRPTHSSVEWVFRHDKTAARVTRVFDGRMWHEGAGVFRIGSRNGGGNVPHLTLTVEDIGS